METIHRRIDTDNIENHDWPFPLEVIPNCMGINLCSVEALTWTKQPDGQLVSVTIHFQPESVPDESEG